MKTACHGPTCIYSSAWLTLDPGLMPASEVKSRLVIVYVSNARDVQVRHVAVSSVVNRGGGHACMHHLFNHPPGGTTSYRAPPLRSAQTRPPREPSSAYRDPGGSPSAWLA
ncbi:hypothetical protein PMIN05_010853 [Paraphaeosphaeria minitans]